MTDKGNLYDNLAKYCEKRAVIIKLSQISMNFLPITFHLNREGPIYSLRENIKEFIEFFNYVKDNTNLSNTWIMKPTNMNQGKYKITKEEIYICLILCNHSYNF